MLPNRNSSSQQGSRPRPVNQAQDVGEQGSRDRNLGHLERDMPTVPDHLDADLYRRLAHRGQRPVLSLDYRG